MKPNPLLKTVVTAAQGLQALFKTLEPFLGTAQAAAIRYGLRGEEGELFRVKLEEYASRVQGMPKTYETEERGVDSVAHLHYFTSAFDWYVTERDIYPEQLQAFGVAYLGRNPEVGYINLVELLAAGAELDLYFTPAPLREIARARA